MLSKLSVIFSIIGVVILSFSYIYSSNFEILMISGFGIIFISILLSLVSVFKREQGKYKFLPALTFFLCSFIITMYDPFQIVRLLTWIKN